MSGPYQPPSCPPSAEENDDALKRRRKTWRRTLWISIAAMVVPPLIGLAGIVAGILGAFGELSKSGRADPADLANNISMSLLSAVWVLAISLPAFIVTLVAAIRLLSLPKPRG